MPDEYYANCNQNQYTVSYQEQTPAEGIAKFGFAHISATAAAFDGSDDYVAGNFYNMVFVAKSDIAEETQSYFDLNSQGTAMMTYVLEDGVLESISSEAVLSVNGEAIAGAGVWKKYGEGPTRIPGGHFAEGKRKPFTSADFRFTTANGALYVTALKASEDGVYDIHTLGMPEDAREADFNGVIRSVSVLGTDEPVSFSRGRTLQLRTDFRSDMPVVFKICID